MMSYWPRCVLTPYEQKFMNKYPNPDDNRRGPLRRFYPGVLRLDVDERLPTFNLNISRRSRVFGFSVAGDIEHFRVNISDSTGEQYTADTVYLPHLVPGYSQSLPGILGGVGPTPTVGGLNDVYIFNPNVMLMPNQTLTFSGFETEAPILFGEGETVAFQVDFVVHVWEFPGMPGSPL